jgi:hypothetical protein
MTRLNATTGDGDEAILRYGEPSLTEAAAAQISSRRRRVDTRVGAGAPVEAEMRHVDRRRSWRAVR